MEIEITQATPAHKPVLANLFELYLHDFSEYTEADVQDDGRYGSPYLDSFWTTPGRFPFLVRVGGALAGFALVMRGSHLTGDPDVADMDEFFVMRKYRRHGVGEAMARAVFDRFPGRWEVRVMRNNTPAQAFWRAIISRYTGGRFEERAWDDDRWRGLVQFFDSRDRA